MKLTDKVHTRILSRAINTTDNGNSIFHMAAEHKNLEMAPIIKDNLKMGLKMGRAGTHRIWELIRDSSRMARLMAKELSNILITDLIQDNGKKVS